MTRTVTGEVRLRIPGVLRDLAGGAGELRVAVDEAGVPLDQLLSALSDSWPELVRRLRDETGALRRHVNLFVAGEDARSGSGLQTVVMPGAVVHVLPSVAGG
jgi:molybdopterin converting factor small subunit